MADEAIWTITMCDRTMAALINAFALWVFLTLILLRLGVKSRRKGKPMYYTDDPARDFANWDAEQQRELGRLPVCADCGNPIQEETAFEYNGELFCEDCNEAHRVNTGDYIE